MTPIENQIVDAILNAVPLDVQKSDFTSATTFEELTISSLEIINIVFELEESFSIDIETEAMFALHTLGDVARFIETKTAGVTGAAGASGAYA